RRTARSGAAAGWRVVRQRDGDGSARGQRDTAVTPWRRDGETGSATVYVLALAMVLAAAAYAVALTGEARVGRSRAESAADLAALAAAQAVAHGASHPCTAAVRIATAHRASLTSCTVAGGDVDVTVAVALTGVLTRMGPATARA